MQLHTYKRPSKAKGFWAECGYDNVIVAFANQAGGLTVAVSEQQAMDSYNETFECSVALVAEEAKRLRDYLNAQFPPEPPPSAPSRSGV